MLPCRLRQAIQTLFVTRLGLPHQFDIISSVAHVIPLRSATERTKRNAFFIKFHKLYKIWAILPPKCVKKTTSVNAGVVTGGGFNTTTTRL
jgi:hypothetical protein